MKIMKITDQAYKVYGRVMTEDYDVASLIKAMEETQAPEDSVIYYPSIEEFEQLSVARTIQNSLFGGLPIQIGYCNGTNHLLNAVEYHRNSEMGVAVTDLILLIGRQQDIDSNNQYDTSKIEAFFVPAGTVYEMYATTLHYAPCSVDGKPFKNVVVLPRDTNTEVTDAPVGAKEDVLLTAKNKWLIAHKDANIPGAFCGLVGENISI
ncbi:MAG: DUF4867 family protein [Clostridiales bacterium]|nr:DUF4867 family protein [Clostridiales bacterium]